MKPGFTTKKWLSLERIESEDELKEHVTNWFQTQATGFEDTEIKKLLTRYENFVDVSGNYMEK